MKDPKFQAAVDKAQADGTLLIEDAPRKLTLNIEQRHCEIAERENEGECVVAQAVKDATPLDVAVSIGGDITKVLYLATGQLYRYSTPKRVSEALRIFDRTGKWPLAPGAYHFMPPGGHNRLIKNCSKKEHERRRGSWDKFVQRLAENGPSGKGLNKHKPVSSREITVLHSSQTKSRPESRPEAES